MSQLRLLIAGLGVAAGVYWGDPPVALSVSLWSLALVVGLPHGALDYASAARARARLRGPRGWAMFHIGYVALAIIFALFLIAAPSLGLVLFCVLSAWHFGQSDLATHVGHELRWLLWFSRGLVIVGVPISAHPQRTTEFLSLLLPEPTWAVASLEQSGLEIPVFFCALHIVVLLRADRRRPQPRARRALEIVDALALMAMLWTLDPLVGFALYFVVWHSADHFGRAREQLGGSLASLAKTALTYTCAALFAALLGLAMVLFGASTLAPEQWVRALAVLVAAVTLPHMIVVEALIRGHHFSSCETKGGPQKAGQTLNSW